MLGLKRDPELTRSEQLEAECRRNMARLTKSRGFDSGKVRAEQLAEIDAQLDEWNELTCRA